jgi:hypothetical protein
MHYSLLQDSTEIQYEIGQITLYSSTNTQYIAFVDSTSNVCEYYLRTKPFKKLTLSNDTIYFRRFANFDDKFAPIKYNEWIEVDDDEQLDSIISAIKNIYANKEIYPNSNYFAPTSTIKYVVELRKQSDNTLLKRLDSLIVFRSDSGFLRFRVGCYEANVHKQKLGAFVPVDTPIYLVVQQEKELPIGSTITEYGLGVYQHNPVDDRLLLLHKYQYFDNCEAEKKSSISNSNQDIQNYFTLKSLGIQNNIINDNKIILQLNVLNSGTALIKILNTEGNLVFTAQQYFDKGIQNFTIDGTTLPNGAYIGLVQDQYTVFSTKFLIQK